MDLMKIVKDGLIANGCDGLFVEDLCACKLDDLAPCGEFNEHCCQGVLIDIESCPNCTPSAPCDFHMGHKPNPSLQGAGNVDRTLQGVVEPQN